MGPITENFFDKFCFYILEREVEYQELSIHVGFVLKELQICTLLFYATLNNYIETTLNYLSNEREFLWLLNCRRKNSVVN